MKTRTTFFAAVAVFLWMVLPACSSGSESQDLPAQASGSKAETAGVSWHDYDEGIALGKKEGKKILLHFYADWCGFCKKMDREIFSKSDAADFINQNFVPIRINSDNEKQLSEAYRVSGLPTTWFLDTNGEKIMSLPGYLPKEMFMSFMKFVQTDSYRSMSFRTFMGVE